MEFPAVDLATQDGLLAVGGDLSPDRILLAYKSGIFPWFNDDSFILWWSPDPRMVLYPDRIKISKSMRKLLLEDRFEMRVNTRFKEVVEACATISRKDQKGSWITPGMEDAYVKLNELGYAKSYEVWDNDRLVGGLYGVDLGNVFCGESMFSKTPNASKFALINLAIELKKKNYSLIDCQQYSEHLKSLGAEEIPRDEFMRLLQTKDQAGHQK